MSKNLPVHNQAKLCIVFCFFWVLPFAPLWIMEIKKCLNELKFCEVPKDPTSSICWKFQLFISWRSKLSPFTIQLWTQLNKLFRFSSYHFRASGRRLWRVRWFDDQINIWFSYIYGFPNSFDYCYLSVGYCHYCGDRMLCDEEQIRGSERKSSCTNIYCRNILTIDWFNKLKVLTFYNLLCISYL